MDMWTAEPNVLLHQIAVSSVPHDERRGECCRAGLQVITLPRSVEDLILQAVSINKYAIYFVLLAALLAVSKVMRHPAYCRSFATFVQHMRRDSACCIA